MVEIIFGWVFVVGVGLVVVEIGAVVYDATAKVVSKTASKIGRKASDLAAGVRNRVAASRQQREKLRALNAKARALQMGLLQLSLSPDFRRAAAVAAKSDMVPLAFRRRQFQRFRPRLVVHFAACLRLGSDPKALTKSLTELLGHLGIAAFESEYIRIEAERALAVPPVPISFDQRIQIIHNDHEQRVAAIRGLATISGDIRDQLLESEDNRYRDALLSLGDNPETTNHQPGG